MIDDNRDAGVETTQPTGIWPTFVNHLSARAGLSQCWLQFIMLVLGSLTAYSASEGFHRVS